MSKRKIFPGYPLNSEITALAIEFQLNGPECAVLRHICASMSRTNPKCWKNHETLAHETRYSRRTVLRVTKLLSDKKILLTGKRRSKNGNHHNVYTANHGEKGWRLEDIRTAAQSLAGSDSAAVLKGDSLPSESDFLTSNGDCMSVESDSLSYESTLECFLENKPIESSSSAEEDENSLHKNSFKEKQEEKGLIIIEDLTTNSPTGEMKYVSGQMLPPPILIKIYGRVPPKVQDLTISTDIPADLRDIVKPFKKRSDLDTPLAAHVESQLDDFIKKLVDAQWNENAEKPGAPFYLLLRRFCRSQAASWYGFKPKSLEELQAEEKAEQEYLRKTQEQNEKEERELREREERKMMQKKRNCKLARRILDSPDLLHYLEAATGINFLQAIRGVLSGRDSEVELHWIREELNRTMRESNQKTWDELCAYCKINTMAKYYE